MTGQAGVNGRTLTNVDDVVVRGCDGSGMIDITMTRAFLLAPHT